MVDDINVNVTKKYEARNESLIGQAKDYEDHFKEKIDVLTNDEFGIQGAKGDLDSLKLKLGMYEDSLKAERDGKRKTPGPIITSQSKLAPPTREEMNQKYGAKNVDLLMQERAKDFSKALKNEFDAHLKRPPTFRI